MTKKAYSSPKLTVHGSVEHLTQVAGDNAEADVLVFNGEVVLDNDDSRDFELP
jgi:hypothetical protein